MTRVAIGLPAFTGGAPLVRAAESLLAQSYSDFVLVIVDDLGSDTTEALVQRELVDARVAYVRNARRVGMVDNWNRALRLASETSPDVEYFAWASDHDLWEPDWLQELVTALDAAPDAVLAYPLSDRLREGSATAGGGWRFTTAGQQCSRDRLNAAARGMVAGDMIYGLFRLAPLRAVGPFPRTTYPDRLLLARLALEGEFVQVPRLLWHRVVTGPSTPRRQRKTLFGEAAPSTSYLPWWLNHACRLIGVAGWNPALRYAIAGALLAARSVPSRITYAISRTAGAA